MNTQALLENRWITRWAPSAVLVSLCWVGTIGLIFASCFVVCWAGTWFADGEEDAIGTPCHNRES